MKEWCRNEWLQPACAFISLPQKRFLLALGRNVGVLLRSWLEQQLVDGMQPNQKTSQLRGQRSEVRQRRATERYPERSWRRIKHVIPFAFLMSCNAALG